MKTSSPLSHRLALSLALLVCWTLSAPALSIMSYGAAGNGTTDDTTAVNNAISAAVSSGDWLTGQGKTYAVTGAINLPAGLSLENAKFKQLGHAASDTITLSGSAAHGLRLRDVTVNRNGTGNNGGLDTAAGIWITNSDDIVLERCEVYGNDRGTGLRLLGCKRFVLDRPYIHDMRYNHAGEGDDQINGIIIGMSSQGAVRQPIITEMGRTASGDLHNRFSRGLCVSGCKTITIDGATISRVDQAIDLTGSPGNSNIAVTGGAISHVYSNGVKLANTAVGCVISGVVVEHAGFNGFLASSPDDEPSDPADDLVNKTRDILFTGCFARNIASSKQTVGTQGRGFVVERQPGLAGSFPKNIQFTGCTAMADEGTFTFTVFASGEFTVATNFGTPLSLGTRVNLSTTAVLPTGLSTSTDYWLIPIPNTNRFKLASSYSDALAGTAVSTSSSGSGTQTVTLKSSMIAGFFVDVDPVDSTAPVFAFGCRASGFTLKAFYGDYNLWQAPMAIVNRTSAQAVNTGTWTDAKPTTDVYDVLGLIDTSAPAADFVVPFSGVWRLEANLEFAGNGTGYRAMQFLVDTGSGYSSTNTGHKVSGQTSATETSLNGYWEGPLKRGDKVKVQAYQNSGSSRNLTIPRMVFRQALDTGIQ